MTAEDPIKAPKAAELVKPAKAARSGRRAPAGKLPESAAETAAAPAEAAFGAEKPAPGKLPASRAGTAPAGAAGTASEAAPGAAGEAPAGGSMRDELRTLLALPPEALEIRTEQTAILAALLAKARKGDVSAASFIRDTVGERPADRKDRADGKAAGEIIVKWRD